MKGIWELSPLNKLKQLERTRWPLYFESYPTWNTLIQLLFCLNKSIIDRIECMIRTRPIEDQLHWFFFLVIFFWLPFPNGKPTPIESWHGLQSIWGFELICAAPQIIQAKWLHILQILLVQLICYQLIWQTKQKITNQH